MSENRLRAVIYARFSSHNQDEISIADQVSVGTRFIEDMRADLVGIYADEAKTGTNDKRDDFRRLMSDAKKDVYDIVVVWNTNRLNRDMLNAFVMIAELFKWGKDFRSVTQSDLNDPNNPMRLIMYAIHAWHDEEYSNALSTDVKRGQGEKAKQGHPAKEWPSSSCCAEHELEPVDGLRKVARVAVLSASHFVIVLVGVVVALPHRGRAVVGFEPARGAWVWRVVVDAHARDRRAVAGATLVKVARVALVDAWEPSSRLRAYLVPPVPAEVDG